MDHARSFAFVKQVPRRTVQEVSYHDDVYDRQVLMNESWESFCHRVGLDPIHDRPPHVIHHDFLRSHMRPRHSPTSNQSVEDAVSDASTHAIAESDRRYIADTAHNKRTTYNYENWSVNHEGQMEDAEYERPQKNITESWEEYLERVVTRDNAVRAADGRSDRIVATEMRHKKHRADFSSKVMDQLKQNELHRQAKYLTPVQHSLLLDFEALKAARMAAECQAMADQEQRVRSDFVEALEVRERDQIVREAIENEAAVQVELRRQRMEMEAALAAARAEQEARDAAAREEAERRRKEEVEADRRRREAEELAKKEERRRKEEERRARKAAEKKAARDGYKKPAADPS